MSQEHFYRCYDEAHDGTLFALCNCGCFFYIGKKYNDRDVLKERALFEINKHIEAVAFEDRGLMTL